MYQVYVGDEEISVPKEIFKYIDDLNSMEKQQILKKYDSVEDYYVLLYFYYFVKKKEIYEIAEDMGYSYGGIYNRLRIMHWNYSNDYDENKALFEKERKRLIEIKKLIIKKAEDERVGYTQEFRQFFIPIHKQGMKKSVYQKIGFDELYEFVLFFYYAVKCYPVVLTPEEYGIMFDEKPDTMFRKLKKIGLSLSPTEAAENVTKRGRRDSAKALSKGRLTRLRNIEENGGGGSKNENIFRNYIATVMHEYLPTEKYEYVIGVNAINIIGNKEIDVPIMIYDVESQVIHRFAVEYNGDCYHMEENDKEKEQLLHEKGWKYIAVFENSKTNDWTKGVVESKARQVCKEIRNLIME